jgi:hypothetical protein
MALSLPPSSGLKLHLASWQPNGLDGAGLISGSPMATWKNRGSGVADAIQTTPTNQPTWKSAANRWPAVAFDSVADRFDLPGSDGTLRWVHETGVFDLFVALRGAVNKYGVVFGNGFNPGDLGFLLERTHNVARAPLTFYLWLGSSFRAHPTNSFHVPAPPSFEPGVANKLLIRCAGVGTQIQSSANFSTFFAGGGVLPALPTGPATNVATIGSYGANHFLGGEILDVALYDRNLSSGELTIMATYFAERHGI